MSKKIVPLKQRKMIVNKKRKILTIKNKYKNIKRRDTYYMSF